MKTNNLLNICFLHHPLADLFSAYLDSPMGLFLLSLFTPNYVHYKRGDGK